ncbi:MAG TPA: peptidyl-prolyl cis-trans isomerase, partial [Pirellulales bacterium]
MLAAAAVVGACIAIRMIRGPAPADAKDQPRGGGVQQASATTPAQQQPQVVAVVNNEQIGRQELAQECLTHYGKDVLEAMVNKYLIVQYCQRQNVTVSKEEVNAEIDRMARKFSLAVDQWLKMLKDERGITPEQYANDIVWPTLALKKLAADRLKPTQQELQDAFETEFGEQVKARIILLKDPQMAAKVAALAKSDPESFGALAVKYSIDASASANGLIPPIRRHVGDPKLEQRVFAMRPGDITEPIQVGDQLALVKCEGHIPPAKTSFDQVRDKLADVIRERKLHTAAADVFQNLHKQAVIQNIYNDPVRSQQMPGVAAIVNDRKITVRELAEECIDKHGAEALEGTVNRRLLEQAVRNKRLTVTDEDLNSEIARAAVAAGKVDKQKRPDMDGWIKTVCEEQGITAEIYYHDAVWPSVALRKLVGDVAVSKDDLDRGFIANYGPRVRCRVIMMTNQRRAQEVWEMARTELQKK